MPTTLASGLKMAKSRRMKFLLVAKGTEASRLLLAPGKVKNEEVKEAMTATKGRVIARGECYLNGKLMVFECVAKPPTTLKNLLMKTIRTEAKMSLLVQARHAAEVASEQELVAKNRVELVDRVKRISELMKDLKGKVEAEEWAGWNDIRTNAVKEARDTKSTDWSKVLGELEALEKELETAALETAGDTEAAQKLHERQEEAVEALKSLKDRLSATAYKDLKASNLALDRLIEKKEWEKANQQLRDFLKAIKAAQLAAEKAEALDDDGESIRNLFSTEDDKTEKAKAKAKEDAEERAQWTKVIKELAQRARKLDDPHGIPVRNRIAGLFPLLKDGDWEDVKDRVERAKEMLAEAEKTQKDTEALNEKKLAEATRAIKDLAQRARKLKDAKGNDLSKKVAALTPLLSDKDWPAIEKQLAEVEQEVKDAENRLEEDDKQRAKFTAEFKKLAARAAKLDDTALRNRVAGLFSLIQEKDWEGIRKSLDEAVQLVEAAEKRRTTAPPE